MYETGNPKTVKAQRTLIYVFFALLTLLSIIPFWVVIVNATRSAPEIQQGLSLIPSDSAWSNWTHLRDQGFNIFQGYGNSFFIAASATILSLYFSSLTAYAFIVYEFKGKKLIWGIILLLIMIPTQVSIIGFYKFMANMDLLNNYIPLILPSVASAPTVFFMKQYLETIYHPALVDSARVDGASEIFIFHRIILPLMRPALATMAIFSFIASWNNFLLPLILINDRSMYTLPMLVQLLTTDGYKTEYGAMYMGITLSVVPLLFLYAFLSRYIIGGVTAGSIKQ
ncbi:carbohydrate ABC transporter permease [Alkalibacterium putridalgicola]|uniref:ABC-type glycerol-3-phosphate transport system, permease component n=1 Tax=Alkalibacterium putridalgicola TaxID=426703 RepID=A0A1H7S2U6_9LACT|nr:carbohydrate ABC transporter permease [Alkalibacterium putridalgicola]GEK88350.1 L-arabinose transport system permease protein AraQ [Alkalibacterium putridalgicola]SEL65867.1 ABC-type glycerol-3-phosphate transport system, permease component [Alkalibacterium putridalgicola]